MDKTHKQERRWLVEFALISLFFIGIAGFFLAQSFKGDVRERVIGEATDEAELVSRVALDGRSDGRELDRGLPAERIKQFDAAKSVPTENEVQDITVRNRAFRVVYASQHSAIGREDTASPTLESALQGSKVWEISGGEPDGLLTTIVPVRTRSGEPAGTAELRMPFAPIAARISAEQKELTFTLFGALGVLYLVLCGLVAVASQNLRQKALDTRLQAQRDALTGLPNRANFRDQVERAAKAAQRKKTLAGVMVMDLDRFKEVNDTLGHFHGDLVLQRIGARLQSVLRGHETIARMGGDEFAILLPEIEEDGQARKVAKRIIKALDEPINVSGLSLQVEGSLGIAVFPKHGDSVDALLRAADVAMYVAKERRTGFEFYATEEHQHDASSLALIGEMRRAMDAGELVLHYQPKASLATGGVKGCEALARWNHPGRGMLSPDEFIPLAEHSSLLRPVTLYLLETAIRQCKTWQNQGHDMTVAVNLSVVNLLDNELPADLGHLLSESRLEPQWLELEITESTIMKDPRRAMQILTRLSDMGIRLSIDDFGTGYSSLAYLKQLPVHTIKIDKSFVLTMDEDEGNATIVQSTIDLGHNLGLAVVAEGVETEESYARLGALGCDYAQGYFLSRPLPPEKFTVWMRVFASPVEGDADGGEHRDPPSDEDAQLQEWIVA
jgi:diguanylate cyclase (GGDEF)-like protein